MTSFTRNILFILIFYALFFLQVKAQDYVLNYEQFTTKEGLANNFVSCIIEDKQGFMWFGTQDGLCRYDGHSYKVYKTDIEKNHILLSNNILSLAVINDSVIYVGTKAGLHLLNTHQNTITSIEEFKNKNVSQILIDTKKTIWVVNQYESIFIKKSTNKNWQPVTDIYTNYKHRPRVHITEQTINGEQKIMLSIEDRIGSGSHALYQFDDNQWKLIFDEKNIYLDAAHKGNLLVTKGAMIHEFDLEKTYKDDKLSVKYIQARNRQNDRIASNFSAKSYQNNLYIPLSTSILVVNLSTYKVIQELKIPNQNNVIKSIHIDTRANLWVATSGSGVYIFPTHALYTIRGYRHNENNNIDLIGLSKTSIRAIYRDTTTNTTWIGTYSEKRILDIFWKDSIKTTLPIYSYAFVIKEDKKNKNTLWIATNNSVLKVQKYPPKVIKSYFIDWKPRALEVISDSILLFSDVKYLYVFDIKKERIIKKTPFSKITYLYQDRAKKIWIGTETDGFACWDIINDTTHYYNPEKKSRVSSLCVKNIYQDTKGLFWIATTKGIYSFNEKTKSIKKFDEGNGLPNNVVYTTLEDENYNLWLSTNKGISKFDISNETFTNFDVNDGLQDDEYNTHSFHKSSDGELFFGGIKGVDAFFPDDLAKNRNKNIPNLFFTGLKQRGEDIKINIPIEKIKEITLPSDSAQMLTFEFAALNFYQSKKNQYAYKIKEIDTSWVQLGNKNEIMLTNLATGNYTLCIKGSNNHGVWNEEGITLKIKIIPPFWQQNWFLFSLMMLFLMGFYVLYKVRIYQSRRREEKLEIQIKERTKELATANKSKDQLFAIIAHDLRSPLTAFEDISNQIEYFLRKNKPERLLELGKHIDTSIQNMNILLNNLLGWALIQQNHKIQINPQTIDLSETVERMLSIYKNVAQSNQINLKNFVKGNIEIRVDIDSFQTILRNLISNALKYTPENGTVILQTLQDKESVTLVIQDTGVGMNEEIIKAIFEPNSIQSNRGIRGEKGTGLGLALCQEFAQINNIKMEVESQPNEGTIFYLTIPTP
ncbi:two-component regulator propeller domain-containing protein [Bernardetia sp. OM2101]|uniref:ligand-binding sensor domain-containing protein n=1 Tax=Bernardetia sp. OM2101 TaxID=3344876 RepID=UPI0035CFC308